MEAWLLTPPLVGGPALLLRSTEPFEERLIEATGGLFNEAVSKGEANDDMTTEAPPDPEDFSAKATRKGLLTAHSAEVAAAAAKLLLEVSADL